MDGQILFTPVTGTLGATSTISLGNRIPSKIKIFLKPPTTSAVGISKCWVKLANNDEIVLAEGDLDYADNGLWLDRNEISVPELVWTL